MRGERCTLSVIDILLVIILFIQYYVNLVGVCIVFESTAMRGRGKEEMERRGLWRCETI